MAVIRNQIVEQENLIPSRNGKSQKKTSKRKFVLISIASTVFIAAIGGTYIYSSKILKTLSSTKNEGSIIEELPEYKCSRIEKIESRFLCEKQLDVFSGDAEVADYNLLFVAGYDKYVHLEKIMENKQCPSQKKRLRRHAKAEAPNTDVDLKKKCNNYVSEKEKFEKLDTCEWYKNVQELSAKAADMDISALTAMTWTKIGISTVQTAAKLTKSTLDWMNPLGSKTDAVFDAIDATFELAKDATDHHYNLNVLDVKSLEKKVNGLRSRVDTVNECKRPSTAVLECEILDVSYQLKVLPVLNQKMDESLLKLDLIETISNEISKDVKDINEDIENVLQRISGLQEYSRTFDSIQYAKTLFESGLKRWESEFTKIDCGEHKRLQGHYDNILNYITKYSKDMVDNVRPKNIENWKYSFVVEFKRLRKYNHFLGLISQKLSGVYFTEEEQAKKYENLFLGFQNGLEKINANLPVRNTTTEVIQVSVQNTTAPVIQRRSTIGHDSKSLNKTQHFEKCQELNQRHSDWKKLRSGDQDVYYKVYENQPRSWTAAVDFCVKENAQLAKVTSEFEHKELAQYVLEKQTSSFLHSYQSQNYWLGGFSFNPNKLYNHDWFWFEKQINGNKQIKKAIFSEYNFSWKSAFYKDYGYNCLIMLVENPENEDKGKLWNYYRCNENLKFVCEVRCD